MTNRLLDLERSPTLKLVKNKKFQNTVSRVGSVADLAVPGAKTAGLAVAGKPGQAIANLGGGLGEVGYQSASRAIKTAKRFKGGAKQKAIAAARGARTGMRKGAKDLANDISGGLIEAAEALPGAGVAKKKLGSNKYVKGANKLLNKSVVSKQRFRTATAGVFNSPIILSTFKAKNPYKLYFFEDTKTGRKRNTGVTGRSVSEARKNLKRPPSDRAKVYKSRQLTDSEKKTAARGGWVRGRADGASPNSDRRRGFGPSRRKKKD